METLKDLLEYLKRYNDSIAIQQYENRKLVKYTYLQLYENVKRMQSYYMDIGVRGINVAIIAEDSFEWIVHYLALVTAGAVVVAIDKELPCENIEILLKKSNSRYVVLSEKLHIDIKQEGISVIPIGVLGEITYSEEKDISLKSDDEAMIVFTSGTTGEAKGVVLTHKNLLSVIRNARENIPVKGNTFSVLPFNHTYGLVCNIFIILEMGGMITINDKLKYFRKNLKEVAPDVMFMAPAIIEKLYSEIERRLKENRKEKILNFAISSSELLRKIGIDMRRYFFKNILSELGGNLNLIITGGANLQIKQAEFFERIGITVLNGYGITECSPLISINPIAKIKNESVGIPLSYCRVKIEKRDNEKFGEILVNGTNVMKGYFQDDVATKKAIEDGWYKTGDLGYIDDEGYIYITGRIKNVIILSNGKNVYPEEIEQLLITSKYIEEVVVKEKDDKIVAEIYPEYSELQEKPLESIIEIIEREVDMFNKEKLPSFERINQIICRTDPFEKTSVGKIKRW